MQVKLERLHFERTQDTDLTLNKIEIEILPPKALRDRMNFCIQVLRKNRLRLECVTMSRAPVRMKIGEEEEELM